MFIRGCEINAVPNRMNMKKVFLLAVICLFSSLIFAQSGQEIKPADLPKATSDYIKKGFPGCQVARAAKVEDPAKAITYIAVVSDGSHKYALCFDSKGAFVKKADKSMLEQYKLKPASAKPESKPQTGTSQSTSGTANPATKK